MRRLRKSLVRRSLLAVATAPLAVLAGLCLLDSDRHAPRTLAEAEREDRGDGVGPGRTLAAGDATGGDPSRGDPAGDGPARDGTGRAPGPRGAGPGEDAGQPERAPGSQPGSVSRRQAPGGPGARGGVGSSEEGDPGTSRGRARGGNAPGSGGSAGAGAGAGGSGNGTSASPAPGEPAPSPTPGDLPPGTGLRGEYWDFDSELTKVPDLDLSGAQLVRVDPVVDFDDPTWNVPFHPLETFAVCWRGFFRATDDAHYAFVLGSDDGALLEIDNVPVCGNDRLQGYEESRGERDLAKGLHVVRLRYFQNRGNARCRLLYVGPAAGDPAVVPTELLYPAGSGVEAGRPAVTAVTPAGAKRGETITLTGSGFSEVPGIDKVTFGPAQVPAVVVAASPTSLQVVVPDGVDQGPISVQVGDRVAAGVPYQVGGTFGLLGKLWRAPAGELVASYPDPASPALPDDEQLVGPLDIPNGAAFNLTFPSLFFRACYVGRFYARASGEHRFSLDSDDGSRLLVDGQPVVDDSGLHPRQHAEGAFFLAQGSHEIEVDFYQHGGDASLTLGHADPGGPLGVCPRALLTPPQVYDTAVVPMISALSPASCAPGDQVAIQGQGFSSPDATPVRAFLGGVELAVLSVSPSSVLVQVPASGVATGPVVVRAGPFASAPATLTIAGQGLKAEFWNVGSPLSTLPAFATKPDFARVDGPIDFQEDAAFQVPWSPADHFAVRWSGQLTVPADGSYELCVGSDDGSRLLVDGQVVVENDGIHSYQEVAATVTLTAGAHALTLLFFENEGDARCRLLWTVPGGGGRVVIPRACLSPGS